MDMMLIAIAAVVIIVIIAGVVMMKKKGSNSDTHAAAQKSTNRPKTLAEQQRERELQNQTTTTLPINTSPTVADSVTSTPQPITPLSMQAPASTSTADTASTLSMGGAAAPVAIATTAVTAAATHTMSEPTVNPINPTTAIQPVSGADGIDFDDFDIFKEDSKPSTRVTEPTLATTSPTDELAFDFELDHDSQPHLDTSLSGRAHDLSSTPTASAVTPVHETPLDDAFLSLEANNEDIHFDLSDPIAYETKPETKPTLTAATSTATTHTPTPVADDGFDFGDLDLELPILTSTPNASPDTDTADKTQPVPTPSVSMPASSATEDFSEFEDFGEFNLALDTPAKPSLTSTVEPITPTPHLSTDDIIKDTTAKNEAIMLGDDDFNFDLDDSLFAKDAPVTAPTVDTPTQSSIEPISADTSVALDGLGDTFDQLDAFYAPTHAASTHETTPAFVPQAAIPPKQADTHVPVIPSAPLVAPTAPVVTEDFSQAFEVIKGMDSQQVTLELAEQYIQLGEYDSAKRLLGELSSAAPAVQQNANRLLASLE